MIAEGNSPTNPEQPYRDDSVTSLFGRIEAVACEIDRDERTIKDYLVEALEAGRTATALKILRAWRTTPPRDVVAKYLEDGDGNSE